MLKSYKYGLLPTQQQQQELSKYFGVCRFAFNIGLETKKAAYSSLKVNLSAFDLIEQIVDLKKDYPWIAECPAQAIQSSLFNLDKAYKNFYAKGGFPRFKNKHSKQSISFAQNTSVNFINDKIRLPKLGWVNCVFDRKFDGKIKTVTVSKTTTNKYFVSILVDNQKELPKKRPIKEQTTVGIDLGIKTFAVFSDGTEIKNPKWLRSAKSNLRRQQRSLNRKNKDSRNRERQRLIVARCHEKISNRRKDYLQKLSTEIINKFDSICLEDLNVSGMVKNRRLSLAISEVGWSDFKSMLLYKSEWYGKNIIIINRFDATSKICSNCGTINKELKLQHRECICKKCNAKHDRDLNAAINIKKFGLRYEPMQANAIQ